MRFVVDFIGALRDAGLQVSPAESLDALKAIKLLGLDSRATAKSILTLTLVKRQSDKAIFEELFELYFASVEKTKKGSSKVTENALADHNQQNDAHAHEIDVHNPSSPGLLFPHMPGFPGVLNLVVQVLKKP